MRSHVDRSGESYFCYIVEKLNGNWGYLQSIREAISDHMTTQFLHDGPCKEATDCTCKDASGAARLTATVQLWSDTESIMQVANVKPHSATVPYLFAMPDEDVFTVGIIVPLKHPTGDGNKGYFVVSPKELPWLGKWKLYSVERSAKTGWVD